MLSKQNIEAVLFDWAGTLTPYHQVDVLRHWVATARESYPDDAAEIGRRLFEAERRVVDRTRMTWTSATLSDVFAAAGVVMDDRVLDRYFAEWVPHTHTDHDAPEVFAALRRAGLQVGIISNTLWPRSWHDEVFRRDGVLDAIDVAVYSSETEYVKPHPSIFELAMQRLGVAEVSSCVYVGDRIFEDVWGAGSLGMTTVLVPHSTIPEYERGTEEGTPDHVITRLSDVPGLLEIGD